MNEARAEDVNLLLVGGGHTHLMAISAIAGRLSGQVNVNLLSATTRLLYSGMMPGWLAGQYRFDQCQIDLAALCDRSGSGWIEDTVNEIDFAAREAIGASGARYRYDLLSVNVGSANDMGEVGADPPCLIGAKPFGGLVGQWQRWLDGARTEPRRRSVVVIGGGAAAVEIAFALANLIRHASWLAGSTVHLATTGNRLLPGMAPLAARLARAGLKRAGVSLRFEHAYLGAREQAACFEGREPMAADLAIIANGARPPAWLVRSARRAGVSIAADGGLQVDATLRSISHPEVFAAGDCATFAGRQVPKSGLHALKQAPVLARNLAFAAAGGAGGTGPAWYVAQRWSLALLNRCDGSAIGAWGPLGFAGRWAWRWKDRIDQGFVDRFR